MPRPNTNQTFCLHWGTLKIYCSAIQTMPVVLAYRVRRVIDSEFSKFPRMPGRFGSGPTSTINRIDKPWHGQPIVDVHTARFYLWTMLRCCLEDIVVDKLTVTNLRSNRLEERIRMEERNQLIYLRNWNLRVWIKGMESVALFLTSFYKLCLIFITIDKILFLISDHILWKEQRKRNGMRFNITSRKNRRTNFFNLLEFINSLSMLNQL